MPKAKHTKQPISTEEYLRDIFNNQSRSKDRTPRTLRSDGSMSTEDYLREVVFGVQRDAAPAKSIETPEPNPTAKEIVVTRSASKSPQQERGAQFFTPEEKAGGTLLSPVVGRTDSGFGPRGSSPVELAESGRGAYKNLSVNK